MQSWISRERGGLSGKGIGILNRRRFPLFTSRHVVEPTSFFVIVQGVTRYGNGDREAIDFALVFCRVSERALRFAVLWRRMMQGTYHATGDRWVERMLSRRETCRLRGKPTFPVLVDAVTCYFNRLYQGLWYTISHRQLIDEGRCRCQATRMSPSVLGVYAR
jgi:hypothetical protein